MVKIKKIDYFDLIMKVVMVILSAIAIYWLILKIIGKSPELSYINFILISALITVFITFYHQFGEFKGEMKEFKLNVKESFLRVREDMQDIKNDLTQFKKDIINEIRKK